VITKSTVKKVAKKQIAKAAPTLTVGNATALGGVPASSYVDHCPAAAPTRSGDVCFSGLNGLKTWDGALRDCAGKGLRLPGISEAMLLFRVAPNGETLVDEIVDTVANTRGLVMKTDVDTGPYSVGNATTHTFYCVASPSN